jgi:hypothetical protein
MNEYIEYVDSYGHAPTYETWRDMLSKASYSRYIYFEGNDGAWLNQIGDQLRSQGINMIVDKSPCASKEEVNSNIDFYAETYGSLPSSWPWESRFSTSYVPQSANMYEIAFEFQRPAMENLTAAEYVAQNPWIQDYCQRNDCSAMGFGFS